MLLAHLNWFDYFLLAVILLSAVIGLLRGFVREIISLLTWFVAFCVGILFSGILALVLDPLFKSTDHAYFVAFILLFVVVLIIGALINFIVGKMIGKSAGSVPSRFLGLVFGFLRGGFIILFIVFIITNTALQEKNFFTASKLSYWFQDASVWISAHVVEVKNNGTESLKDSVKDATKSSVKKLKKAVDS